MPPQEECRYADNESEELEDMSPFENMSNSDGGNDVIGELFCRQSTNGHVPLGLNLDKAPSALELIQNKLALGSKVTRKEAPCATHIKPTAVQGMKPSKKLRAPSFHASILRIGDWELKSRYKGDLVAKFYFVKSKVVWEMINEGLKRKIEIKWSDISALRITCPKHLPGVLDITVSEEPQFFKEGNTLPYRSTRWVATTDFTGGQSSMNSRHVLQCGPGIMDKHIENLLSIDHRLYLLSQEGNINQKSLSNESSYRGDGDNLFGTAQTGQSMPLYPMPTGTTTVGLNDSGALQGEHFQSSVTEESSGQTLLQNQPSNISPETMALEQIRENLLSDNDDENVEQQDVMSTANSFSCLIGQAAAVSPPPPPPPDVEATQVINISDQFSPLMEWPNSPWEPSPENAEMLEYLSQLFPW
ncbi:hypothetical protein VPH35_085885 [Triticum aestivum]